MKILLTGASGLLGSAFARAANRRGHQVVGVVGAYGQEIEGVAETERLDLADLEALERFVLNQFPDAIVNCAAISDAIACESDPETSRQINALMPEKLALLARHLFATLIHISSEQVFDGNAEIYAHDSQANPVNEYGRQKLESERRVSELASEFATILRLPLLNGNSPGGERSLHERLFQIWERGETAGLFTDEVRQVCLSDNAAEVMLELCERPDMKGVFNWAGANPLSRFEMGISLLKRFGLPESLVEPRQREANKALAKRQARLAFDLQPLEGKLKTAPLSFENQLDALVVPLPRRAWYNSI